MRWSEVAPDPATYDREHPIVDTCSSKVGATGVQVGRCQEKPAPGSPYRECGRVERTRTGKRDARPAHQARRAGFAPAGGGPPRDGRQDTERATAWRQARRAGFAPAGGGPPRDGRQDTERATAWRQARRAGFAPAGGGPPRDGRQDAERDTAWRQARRAGFAPAGGSPPRDGRQDAEPSREISPASPRRRGVPACRSR
jgi:hypothetical protein